MFLAVLVVCTWALAWWQWTRFQSGSGTFQNLGYAFQWPFFGLFFVFAYRKILAYESEKLAFEAEQQKDNGSGDSATPQVPPTSRGAQGATGASPQFFFRSGNSCLWRSLIGSINLAVVKEIPNEHYSP